MNGLSSAVIAELFRAACRAELDALKPGNVQLVIGGGDLPVERLEACIELIAERVLPLVRSVERAGAGVAG